MKGNFELLPSQKNEILELLKDAEANPSEFRWDKHRSRVTKDGVFSILSRNDTDFYFAFDNNNRAFYVVYSPGEQNVQHEAHDLSWILVKWHFKLWLDFLYREIKSPDLWGQLEKLVASQKAELPPTDWENPFSKEEKVKLDEALANIEKYIKRVAKTTEEQNKIVIERLDYLTKSLERLNRRDWVNNAFSTVLQIVSHLALNPKQAKAIWNFIANAAETVKLYLPFLGG